MLSLSQAAPGNEYEIKWTFGIPEVLELLKNYHLTEGNLVRVIAQSAGDIIVQSDNCRLALGKDVADRIKI